MASLNSIFNVLVLIFVILSEAYCQDIGQGLLGCGGFIKSDVEIDYSKVEIKLYNKQGSLKYQTDCAPHNGYYLIPLYDKGDYVLKVEPPDGWLFEPTSVDLHVDGSSDACSRGEDVNFIFKGFGIQGKVISRGLEDGPEGVTVTLKKVGSNKVLQTTTTVSRGFYNFNPVLPGDYVISASHPVWSMLQASVKATVTQEGGYVGSQLVIRGYDAKGRVMSERMPLKGVTFLLYSDTVVASLVDGCDKKDVKQFVGVRGKEPICHSTSDEKGEFLFKTLPSGKYTLVPFYNGDNMKFDVEPSELRFVIIHESITLPQEFYVKGFNVKGRVLTSVGGKPVTGATVLLNGDEKSKTDNNGNFALDGMKPGSYALHVRKENIYFDTKVVKITPNTPQLPEIIADRFQVCGQISSDSSISKLRTILIEGASNSEVKSDDNGKFCAQLAPAKYKFRVVVDREESDRGLSFYPSVQTVQVKDEPLLSGIIFSQFKAKVGGTVQCDEKLQCDNAKVVLRSKEGTSKESSTTVKNGKFVFNDVLPGSYEVSIIQDNFCWAKGSLPVQVVNKDVNDVLFKQQGYLVNVATTHGTAIQVTGPRVTSPLNLKLDRGNNNLCLPSKGKHTFVTVGCHYFGQESFTLDTSSETLLTLTATKHLMTGKIVTNSNSTITLKVQYVDKEESVMGPLQKSQISKDHEYGVSLWITPGDKIILTPTSSDLLFKPSQQTIVAADDCMHGAIEFKGTKGVFVEGKVTPPSADIQVTITARDDPDIEPIVVKTNAAGTYRVGPLSSHAKYDVDAEKKGYILNRIEGRNDFEALKLAEINVLVIDEYGTPLSGVLLSISGGTNNYRLNSLTQNDGTYVFAGLEPGKYFLKPVTKEYKLNPQSQMIEVKQGATLNIKVVGKQIAFSCYGIVNSLVGEPESGIIMEAAGKGNCSHYQEEGVTDKEGQFRLRGLFPGCEYVVRLKKTAEMAQHIERLSPDSKLVKVKNSDLDGFDFTAFRPFLQMDITANINAPKEHHHTLKLRLLRENNPESPLFTHQVSQSPFVQIATLRQDGKNYQLKLESSLSKLLYDYELPSIIFKANASYRHFNLDFKPRPVSSDGDLGQHSLFLIPLTLIIGLALAKWTFVLNLLQQANNFIQVTLTPVRGNLGSGFLYDVLNKNKKQKPRKT